MDALKKHAGVGTEKAGDGSAMRSEGGTSVKNDSQVSGLRKWMRVVIYSDGEIFSLDIKCLLLHLKPTPPPSSCSPDIFLHSIPT